MRRKLYSIVISCFILFIGLNTSCNFTKPIEGNGKFVKVGREVSGDFSSLEAEGNFSIVLTQDSIPKLSIETDENLIGYIDTKVKNHKLIIKTKKHLNSAKGITIFVTVNQLTMMELSGAVILRTASKVNLDAFSMELSGASNVAMDLNCFTLNADCSGSCTMKLIGAASDCNIETSGNCDIDNNQMVVDIMNLNVSGGCKVKANVLTSLHAKVSGGGEVEYSGAPEVHKEISGAGSVTKIF